jgi:hypothetical protein
MRDNEQNKEHEIGKLILHFKAYQEIMYKNNLLII